MNEEQAVNLAVTASKELHELKQDTGDIRDMLDDYIRKDVTGVEDDSQPLESGDIVSEDLQPLAETEAVGVEEVQHSEFESDLMQFNYIQTVTGFVIAVVLLLSLGLQIFQAFNKHWR